MHQQHLTTAQTALVINYSFNIDDFGNIKTLLSIDSGTISTSFWCLTPSTHAGLTLRLIAHNVQNALTSSYWSQNYTAIHLFFHNWRFWTRQNDCIALSTMHSFCCVKPSTHSRRTHTLLDAHNVQNALTSSYCNQNYTAFHLFFHNWRFWTHQNDCKALSTMHSFCCVKHSTHAGLPHWL